MRRPKLLTVEAVANYLGVSIRTAYDHVRSGTIPAFKVGRLWRVREDELMDHMEERRW